MNIPFMNLLLYIKKSDKKKLLISKLYYHLLYNLLLELYLFIFLTQNSKIINLYNYSFFFDYLINN